MMNRIAILAIAISVAGCSEDKPQKPSPPRLEITYVADAHRTWPGCGYATNSGHGTVKNIGGMDAVDCYVQIDTECGESYSMWVTPRSLAPGQFGEYITGNFNGTHNRTRVTAHCGGCD